mmetsp:Transcript_21231/g.59007  ORF Transcript_21231/g.59007 Transcript_21231/m.59007 type:complete len:239 (-) Transcript_21231:2145-2861(-)
MGEHASEYLKLRFKQHFISVDCDPPADDVVHGSLSGGRRAFGLAAGAAGLSAPALWRWWPEQRRPGSEGFEGGNGLLGNAAGCNAVEHYTAVLCHPQGVSPQTQQLELEGLVPATGGWPASPFSHPAQSSSHPHGVELHRGHGKRAATVAAVAAAMRGTWRGVRGARRGCSGLPKAARQAGSKVGHQALKGHGVALGGQPLQLGGCTAPVGAALGAHVGSHRISHMRRLLDCAEGRRL